MAVTSLDGPPRTADVVVIGGGVVGAATAFHLSRAGLAPVIVEARPQLCTLTTPVSAGAYRLQFDDLEELELVRESAELFTHFEEITGQREYDPNVVERGYLWLTTDPARAERQRALVAQLHAWGQTDVEIVPGDDVRRRWPWVSPEVVQARWRARDGFLDTKRLTFGLAAGSNAPVATSCEVTGFEVRGDALVAVETTRGRVACGAAVIAAGPMSGRVARQAGVGLPLDTIRRQKLILPQVPEVLPDGPMTIDEDTGTHWRPAYERGAWLLWTDPATPTSEPTMDVPVDHRFAFTLLDPSSPQAAARAVPFWRDVWERGSDHWLLQAGQYTVTPDFRPLIGPTPVTGLFANTGYSGHGIMLSAGAGRLLAEEVAGTAASNPFRFDVPRVRRDHPTL
jgi:glycine/D-amino acid oxidase-like deaminating enzyme